MNTQQRPSKVPRFTSTLASVAVAGSLFLAAPAVAAPALASSGNSSAAPASDQWKDRHFSLRPVWTVGTAVDAGSPGPVQGAPADERASQTFIPERQANGWYRLRTILRNGFLAW